MTSELPPVVLHCFTPEEWATAQATGSIEPPSLETEGFVHCSTDAQIDGVLERFYSGIDGVVIGEIDLKRLALLAPDSELVWEAPAHPDGSPNTEAEQADRYPHIYGPIPLAALIATRAR